MSYAQLRAFHAVAAEGSVQKAAAKLNVTQPAISLHIKRLEAESGTSLFRRSGHRWDLNAEGQALFEATSRMLRAERDAMAILRPAAGKYRGSLVIGADGPHVAIDIVQAFCERRPDIRVEVIMDNAAGTWAALLDLKVDVAVLAGAPESGKVLRQPVAEQSLVALVPADHALATADQLSLASLATEKLIFREKGSSTQARVSAYFQRESMTVAPALTLGSREAVFTAVVRGLGIGFAYDREVSGQEQFHTIPVSGFENANVDEVICLTSSRNTPTVAEFLRCAADIA